MNAVVDLLLFALAFITATAFKAILLVGLIRVDPRNPPLRDPRVFAVEYSMVVTLIPAMTWLLARRGQRWSDLGLHWPSQGGLWLGAAGLTCAMWLGNAALRALGRRQSRVSSVSPYEAIRGHWKAYAVMVIYALIFVGLVEELSFRGFLLSRVATLLGGGTIATYAAAVLIGGLFGLAHLSGGLLMALNGALLGVTLGLAYAATGSLTLVVIAHSLYDAIKITSYFLGAAPPVRVG